MGWFRKDKVEKRSTSDVAVATSAADFMSLLGLGDLADGEIVVNYDNALSVPAIWAATNFISSTFAGLPLHVYKRTDKGRERVTGGLAAILHDAPNDAMSSFTWRKHLMDTVLGPGRHVSFIERDGAGQIINIWPLDPDKLTIKRIKGKIVYHYKDAGRTVKYDAGDVIDMAFMLRPDMLGHRSPIMANRDTVALAIAATRYGKRFFDGGGVPPFAITGGFETPGGMQRATDDVDAAVRKAAKEKRSVLALPGGHEIKALGVDPEKMQLLESRKFMVEEIARVFSLPPVFLQDLTHGTFSNTEQQDLHFVKHTLKRWCEQFEQEMNLKLFGRGASDLYVELNMDGLLRGDFKTRMEANARAIQTGQLKPNEAREMDNRAAADGGDQLLVQGAMVPIVNQGKDGKADT